MNYTSTNNDVLLHLDATVVVVVVSRRSVHSAVGVERAWIGVALKKN